MRVGIVGLRISELKDNPQETLLGNPVRSWALFHLLPDYGVSTSLYIGPKANVDEVNTLKYAERLYRSADTFIKDTTEKFDYVILCGTKIQEILKQEPWVLKIKCPVVLSMCYHNDHSPLDQNLLAQIKAACFLTPRFAIEWHRRHPQIPTFVVTTGQGVLSPAGLERDGSAVFIGHIHNGETLRRMADIAHADLDRRYHVVSSRIRSRGAAPGEYVAFKHLSSDKERKQVFAQMISDLGVSYPENLEYHFLPPGEEMHLLSTASVGLDFCWNNNWTMDNSKVPYYLANGIAPVTEKPSQSGRFVQRFGIGNYLDYGAPACEWVSAIREAEEISIEARNAVQEEAATLFSWKNTAFEVAAYLNGLAIAK